MSTPATVTGGPGAALPDFPWDQLEPAKVRARAHPGGMVDMSIGTPVDPVPPVIRAALAAASDAPGYPPTAGTPALRAAITEWVTRACDAARGFAVLPTIGSKELVAWLPTLLGLGPGDEVAIPDVCYPTYEAGIKLTGASVVRGDAADLGDRPVRLIWINSPGNPDGRVLTPAQLRATVAWARERGAVVASDECYLPLGWEQRPTSVMAACDGDYTGVLAVHSLSKRSNLAGYRAGFVAGDPGLIESLLALRKHIGMIVPAPVQAAMIAALGDESHVAEQRDRYAARRRILWDAVEAAGFRVEGSRAGLYLWCTRDVDGWTTVDWLADRGIIAAPGDFYGPAGHAYVRLALTATDAQIADVAARLKAG